MRVKLFSIFSQEIVPLALFIWKLSILMIFSLNYMISNKKQLCTANNRKS